LLAGALGAVTAEPAPEDDPVEPVEPEELEPVEPVDPVEPEEPVLPVDGLVMGEDDEPGVVAVSVLLPQAPSDIAEAKASAVTAKDPNFLLYISVPLKIGRKSRLSISPHQFRFPAGFPHENHAQQPVRNFRKATTATTNVLSDRSLFSAFLFQPAVPDQLLRFVRIVFVGLRTGPLAATAFSAVVGAFNVPVFRRTRFGLPNRRYVFHG
jgi:hypothetical protein